MAGTITVVLVTGTALAVASQGDPGASGSATGVPADHWSEMAVEMGDQWPEMVEHMQQALGDRFPEMANRMQSMEPFGIDMDGRDMWNDGRMGSYEPGMGDGDRWDRGQMGSYGSGMGGGFGGMSG